MAAEADQVVLLEDASDTEIPTISAPRRAPRVLVAALGSAAVASAAWHSRVTPADSFHVDGVMSAAAFSEQVAHDVCKAVYPLTHWPRSFEDMNWEGHCSNEKDLLQCKGRIVEKFVGDFFDRYIESILEGTNGAQPADKLFVPASSIDQRDWKQRVIERVKEEEKGIGSGDDNILLTKVRPPKWEPTDANPGAICTAIYEERPAVTQAQLEDLTLECRPNHVTYRTLDEKLNTHVPLTKTKDEHRLCDSKDADGVVGNCASEPDTVGAAGQYPAEHSWDVNASLAKCRHLFSHKAFGQDFVSSSMTVLDVRQCLRTGSDRLPTLSRSWVQSCLPEVTVGADPWGAAQVIEAESPRTYGWPGWVLEFVGEYGVVGSDCVADFEGLLNFKGETCPSVCDNGESLAGHITRPTSGEAKNHVPYRVIFNSPDLNKYKALTTAQHKTAKQIMYSEGPLIGLVMRSQELAACASEDTVIFKGVATCETEEIEIKTVTARDMHSIVAHGWGSEGGTPYYRIMSTVFQDEDHEAKIAECALKIFVLPSTSHEASSVSGSSSKTAASVCQRTSDFCTNSAAGYTDTEDCDGDGILDHYCYLVGDSMTPSYEAFLSSRNGCDLAETPCRRSVLPGVKFGCQRPLGWCMHGESYRRDVDCDGDGHFDHVCEKSGHSGFISSSLDCTDTWEEGTEGRKCEPQVSAMSDHDATITYKLVTDSGSCVQHAGSTCVKSHRDWPNTEYPTGGCSMHVEWTTPPASSSDAAGCDKAEAESNETLFLDVLHMDIEDAHFVTEGYLYGERFKVGGVLADSRTATRTPYKVKDKSVIEWHTDLSVEKRGWLACLRLKRRKPTVYLASCTEIGDDVWANLDIKKEDEVVVQCDMTKCGKDKVRSTGAITHQFQRTTNVCDAGWQITKSSKFTIAFTEPLISTATGRAENTGVFQVGF